MTFFQNPHKGFIPPSNIPSPTQNFVPVGPNLLQDPRTGFVYMQTPQGLMLYNQNAQAPIQQPMQMPMQQPVQMPVQPMTPPLYNQFTPYPNMQTNMVTGFNQVAPSFNPRYNSPNLTTNNTNTAQARYATNENIQQASYTPNTQFWNQSSQGSVMTQKSSFKFSETDLRFSTFTPFASRVKDKEIKFEEVAINHVFSRPTEAISVCLEHKYKEKNFDQNLVIVAPDIKIGCEYFITDEEDKKLIKELFDDGQSIKTFISNLAYTLNKASSGEALSFLVEYNKFLTNKVNYILDKDTQSSISIDSFVDDYFELANVINNQYQNTDISDKIIAEVYKANSITKELIEENENTSNVYAIANKKIVIVIPDVIDIYTKHYDKLRKYDGNEYELNPKEDEKIVKLINIIINKLKDEYKFDNEFIIGFTNCTYLNVSVVQKDNTSKFLVS